MKELISKDDLKAEINRRFRHSTQLEQINKVVDDIPPIKNAVQIVRCKDCRWFEEYYTGRLCSVDGLEHGFYTSCDDPNGFCHLGERRTEEEISEEHNNKPCFRSVMVCKEDRIK